MDAVDFITERNRMCKSSASCAECVLSNKVIGLCTKWCFEHPEEVVAAVEQWANEHPRKTRQSEFLKMFPNVDLDSEGVINILPCQMDTKRYPVNDNGGGCKTAPCVICKQEFWMQEVE